MLKAVALAVGTGLTGTVLWAVLDGQTSLTPAVLSLPLSLVIAAALAVGAFELGLWLWSGQDERHPAVDELLRVHQPQPATEEEEVAAKAIFSALQPNLPRYSDWSFCLAAARIAIADLDYHRHEHGLLLVPKSRLENLRAKMKVALASA